MAASCTDCSAAENDLRGPGAPQPALVYLLSDVVPTGSAALFANKEMEAQRGLGGSYVVMGTQVCLPFASWQLSRLPPLGREWGWATLGLP